MTKTQEKAWRRALTQVIDKGRNPITQIGGYVHFIENHLDGMPVTDKQRTVAEKALADIRKASAVLNKIMVECGWESAE